MRSSGVWPAITRLSLLCFAFFILLIFAGSVSTDQLAAYNSLFEFLAWGATGVGTSAAIGSVAIFVAASVTHSQLTEVSRREKWIAVTSFVMWLALWLVLLTMRDWAH